MPARITIWSKAVAAFIRTQADQYYRPSICFVVCRTGSGLPRPFHRQTSRRTTQLPRTEHGAVLVLPECTDSAVRRPPRDTQEQDLFLADRPGVTCSSFLNGLGVPPLAGQPRCHRLLGRGVLG
jgi:hypothetical protein